MRILCVLLLVGTLGFSESVRSFLEEGIYQQDTLGNHKEALLEYEKAIEESHQSEVLMVKVFVRAIECALEIGNAEQAEKLHLELEKKYANVDSQKEKREQFLKQFKPEENTLQELLARTVLEKKEKVDVAKSETARMKGWRFFNQSEFKAGKPQFETALNENPYNADAWNGLGWCYFNLGEGEVAMTAFQKAVELDENNAGALNGMGWASKNQGEIADALMWWRKCVETSPKATAAYNGLVTTYFSEQDYDNAVKYASMWVDNDPTNVRAATVLKNAKNRGGKIPQKKGDERFEYLEEAPWGEFEQCLYNLTPPGKSKILGSGLITITGKDEQWFFDERFSNGAMDMMLYFSASCYQESNLPITGSTMLNGALKHVKYERHRGVQSVTPVGRSKKHRTVLNKVTIDNGQLMSMLRRLPLQNGFSISQQLYHSQFRTFTAKISVVEKVEITVPAGTFSSYPVIVENFSGGEKIQTMEFWIEAEGSHRILKVEDLTWGMELVDSIDKKEDAFNEHRSETCETTIKTPESWYVGRSIDSGRSQEVQIFSPEQQVKGYLLTVEAESDSAEEVFQKDYKTLQGIFTDYTLRTPSKRFFKVGDFEAVEYAADYLEGREEMVEHRCYYVQEDKFHWFVFRVAKAKYETYKQDIETIIKDFRA